MKVELIRVAVTVTGYSPSSNCVRLKQSYQKQSIERNPDCAWGGSSSVQSKRDHSRAIELKRSTLRDQSESRHSRVIRLEAATLERSNWKYLLLNDQYKNSHFWAIKQWAMSDWEIRLELTGAKSPFLPDVRTEKSTSGNELNSSKDEGLTWNCLKEQQISHIKSKQKNLSAELIYILYCVCPNNRFNLIIVHKHYFKRACNHHQS